MLLDFLHVVTFLGRYLRLYTRPLTASPSEDLKITFDPWLRPSGHSSRDALAKGNAFSRSNNVPAVRSDKVVAHSNGGQGDL